MHDPRHAACAGRRVLQSSLEESCKTMAPVQALARPRMVWCTEIEAKRYLKQLFVPGVVRILEELSPEAMYMDRLRDNIGMYRHHYSANVNCVTLHGVMKQNPKCVWTKLERLRLETREDSPRCFVNLCRFPALQSLYYSTSHSFNFAVLECAQNLTELSVFSGHEKMRCSSKRFSLPKLKSMRLVGEFANRHSVVRVFSGLPRLKYLSLSIEAEYGRSLEDVAIRSLLKKSRSLREVSAFSVSAEAWYETFESLPLTRVEIGQEVLSSHLSGSSYPSLTALNCIKPTIDEVRSIPRLFPSLSSLELSTHGNCLGSSGAVNLADFTALPLTHLILEFVPVVSFAPVANMDKLRVLRITSCQVQTSTGPSDDSEHFKTLASALGSLKLMTDVHFEHYPTDKDLLGCFFEAFCAYEQRLESFCLASCMRISEVQESLERWSNHSRKSALPLIHEFRCLGGEVLNGRVFKQRCSSSQSSLSQLSCAGEI